MINKRTVRKLGSDVQNIGAPSHINDDKKWRRKYLFL